MTKDGASNLEFLILCHLRMNPGSSARDVHERISLHGPSTSRTLLCRLKAWGMVRVQKRTRRVEVDPRARCSSTVYHREVSCFYLTRKGERYVTQELNGWE